MQNKHHMENIWTFRGFWFCGLYMPILEYLWEDAEKDRQCEESGVRNQYTDKNKAFNNQHKEDDGDFNKL